MKHKTYDNEYDNQNDVDVDDNLLLEKGKPSKKRFRPPKIDTR